MQKKRVEKLEINAPCGVPQMGLVGHSRVFLPQINLP